MPPISLSELALWLPGAAALGVSVFYGWALWRGFVLVKAERPPAAASPRPISVVVPARNERDRLPRLLDALAAQTLPARDVVVVDDGSTDGTAAFVRARSAKASAVRLVQTNPDRAPLKKHALATGIQAARHDRLAFTDADCAPQPTWLETLARYDAAHPGAVLVGYGPFFPERTLLNRFVRYETLVTAFLTCASAGLGRPYMAVGRNLSYPRRVFERIEGFGRFDRSLSGDDDLLVQEVVRSGAAEVRYVLDPGGFVYSDAPESWPAWFRQKRRHASAGRYYAPAVRFHLALLHASNLVLWLLPAVLGWAGFGPLLARLVFQSALLDRVARAYGEPGPGLLFPFLEMLYVAYNTLVAPIGLLFPPKRW